MTKRAGILLGIFLTLCFAEVTQAASLDPFAKQPITKGELMQFLDRGDNGRFNLSSSEMYDALRGIVARHLGVGKHTVSNGMVSDLIKESYVAPCSWSYGDVLVSGIKKGTTQTEFKEFKRRPYRGEQCLWSSKLGVIVSLYCSNVIFDTRVVHPAIKKPSTQTHTPVKQAGGYYEQGQPKREIVIIELNGGGPFGGGGHWGYGARTYYRYSNDYYDGYRYANQPQPYGVEPGNRNAYLWNQRR